MGNGNSQSLPEGLRGLMEASFGTDFSGVRVHTGSSANETQGARAFTVGNDIAFAPGQYDPESRHGRQLIGHELTHVLQQRQGRLEPGNGSSGNPVLAAEASLSGYLAADGSPAAVHGVTPPPGTE